MYHPLLPLSVNKDDPPVYMDFSVLERAPGAARVRDSMVRSVVICTVLFTYSCISVMYSRVQK